MRFAIVIEKADANYSAYVPNVPGCVATGASVEEVKRNLAEALQFHFEGMRADGDAIPAPATIVDHVEIRSPTKRAAG